MGAYRVKSAGGFTLMEVMVVLVLVSLISTLLMQGFSHVLDLRLRFFKHHEKQVTTTLQTQWFQSVTSGFSSGYADPAYVGSRIADRESFFSGTEEKIQGVSLAALGSEPGLPREVTLELIKDRDGLVLSYSEFRHRDWVIGRWENGDGRFGFLDHRGNWQDHWPVKEGDEETLPRAVCLTVTDARGQITWFSRVVGKSQARSSLRSIFGDF